MQKRRRWITASLARSLRLDLGAPYVRITHLAHWPAGRPAGFSRPGSPDMIQAGQVARRVEERKPASSSSSSSQGERDRGNAKELEGGEKKRADPAQAKAAPPVPALTCLICHFDRDATAQGEGSRLRPVAHRPAGDVDEKGAGQRDRRRKKKSSPSNRSAFIAGGLGTHTVYTAGKRALLSLWPSVTSRSTG
ncbi:hypothetical protein GUJ93_ZPchr0169g29002 [Zizania palustris]|uniref:Uncharacterized protein n=1 Tax=Zizania palustris TaxID=103762 RepID=A0A8J6C3W6_ZIZPA|nr:hypothetical protein GUJ93_ZPchr0169g29002 [Zizania palustris]